MLLIMTQKLQAGMCCVSSIQHRVLQGHGFAACVCVCVCVLSTDVGHQKVASQLEYAGEWYAVIYTKQGGNKGRLLQPLLVLLQLSQQLLLRISSRSPPRHMLLMLQMQLSPC